MQLWGITMKLRSFFLTFEKIIKTLNPISSYNFEVTICNKSFQRYFEVLKWNESAMHHCTGIVVYYSQMNHYCGVKLSHHTIHYLKGILEYSNWRDFFHNSNFNSCKMQFSWKKLKYISSYSFEVITSCKIVIQRLF